MLQIIEVTSDNRIITHSIPNPPIVHVNQLQEYIETILGCDMIRFHDGYRVVWNESNKSGKINQIAYPLIQIYGTKEKINFRSSLKQPIHKKEKYCYNHPMTNNICFGSCYIFLTERIKDINYIDAGITDFVQLYNDRFPYQLVQDGNHYRLMEKDRKCIII